MKNISKQASIVLDSIKILGIANKQQIADFLGWPYERVRYHTDRLNALGLTEHVGFAYKAFGTSPSEPVRHKRLKVLCTEMFDGDDLFDDIANRYESCYKIVKKRHEACIDEQFPHLRYVQLDIWFKKKEHTKMECMSLNQLFEYVDSGEALKEIIIRRKRWGFDYGKELDEYHKKYGNNKNTNTLEGGSVKWRYHLQRSSS